ncbi:Alpha/Beta hydrolase protein [Hyaloraphidium curvatum]|nr:Alpha/Beta hydrolase protein [Hyaloraphidium curvatum]
MGKIVPDDLSSFPLSTARVNGIDMVYVDAKPEGEERDTMIFVHGFPESWMMWRYQIPFFVEKGYRVLAPNTRGYNKGEPRPKAADKAGRDAHYSLGKAAQDIAELLDHAGVKKAIVVGHDWGAVLVQRFALLHQERISKFVLVSIPYLPPAKVYVPLEQLAKLMPILNYQLYFCTDKAEEELNANTDLFIDAFFRPGGPGAEAGAAAITPERGIIEIAKAVNMPRSALLSEKEREAYISFSKSIGGLGGPLQWYRMGEPSFHEFVDHADDNIDVPTLFIGPEFDPFWQDAKSDPMRAHIKDLTMTEIKGAGHWVAYEKPDEVNAIIDGWLEKRAADEA